jgi:hypothetical protein
MKFKKEKIGLAVFIIIAFSFTVWFAWKTLNSGPHISNELKDYGKRAIEVADNYIEGEMDSSTATGKLASIEASVDEESLMSTYVWLIERRIEDNESTYSSNTMLDVIEARNELANYLGIKKIK